MAFSERLAQGIFRFNRWLLHLWIRPTVLGADAEKLGLAESDQVVYVLPFQSSADLLVTDHACEAAGLPLPTLSPSFSTEPHSYFFLNKPEGWFGRRSPRQQSEEVHTLFAHQSMLDSPLKVVPVSLFWGHQPDREKSLFKLILSEKWSVTNRFRKFLAILFHPNHILVQFGEPVALSDVAGDQGDTERQVRSVMRTLRVHFTGQKQAIIGPDLSHRRTLIATILKSPEVRAAIEREASQEDTTREAAQKRANQYAQEIASDMSYRVVRFFHVLLTWLWNNLYDGIKVNNIERLKETARSNEIIYIPCHRSHIDYLLLSYVLYHNGLTLPHIAAGKNLNLPIAGTLLRRAGAFYMRRSFSGDFLYKAVFDEYLHQMFIRGYSVEYFIEGGRSRTGRTLVPRTGMLNMTVRSFQRDASMPICLMPVYFGYERVLESTSYRSELSGSKKKSESVFDMFSIFSSFKHRFGEVTVNFGEPLPLADFLDEELPAWRDNQDAPGFNKSVQQLSVELATRINSAVAVTSVGLVATVLLSSPRQTLDRRQLLEQIGRLAELARLEQFSGDYTVPDASAEAHLDDAVEIAGLDLSHRAFGTTVSADQETSVLLTYYRNNIAHLFAIPSLVAMFVYMQDKLSLEALNAHFRRLYPFIRSEYFLPFSTTEVDERVSRSVENLEQLGLLTREGDELAAPDRTSVQYVSLREVTRSIQSTLERYFILSSLLAHNPEASLRSLETDSAAIAEKLSAIYGINSPDFFEKSLFSGFVNTLRDLGMVDTEAGPACDQAGFNELVTSLSLILPADVRANIQQAVASLDENVEAA